MLSADAGNLDPLFFSEAGERKVSAAHRKEVPLSVFQALVLGVVQGLTEFLPVSSSGHIVLVPALLRWPEPGLPFAVLLHAGTLLALLFYFRRELVQILRLGFRRGPERRFTVLLVLGSLPAAVIGFVFQKQFQRLFGEPFQVALQLVANGFILIGAEFLNRSRRGPAAQEEEPVTGVEGLANRLNPTRAAGVGLAQALAIVPGISRSGSTIAAGLLAGMSRAQAARFSFLLAVPILAGTSLFEIPELAARPAGGGLVLTVGFAASLLSGYVSIAGMIRFLQRRNLLVFAAYCIAAGSLAALVL